MLKRISGLLAWCNPWRKREGRPSGAAPLRRMCLCGKVRITSSSFLSSHVFMQRGANHQQKLPSINQSHF